MSHWHDGHFANEHWVEPRHWWEKQVPVTLRAGEYCSSLAITGGLLITGCYTEFESEGAPNCRYCTHGNEMVTDPCLLLDETAPICQACGGPGGRGVQMSPVDIIPAPPLANEGKRSYDAFLDDAPFATPHDSTLKTVTPKYYFGKIALAYDPCLHGGQLCPLAGRWVCQVSFNNIAWLQRSWDLRSIASGFNTWSLMCTKPNVDGQGQDVNEALQLQPRNFTLYPGRQIAFVNFSTDGGPNCFILHNNYCFRSLCPNACNGGGVATCADGANEPKARVLDWLEMDAAISYSMDRTLYPAERVADITLKNDVLASWNEIAVRIETRDAEQVPPPPAHNSRVGSPDAVLNVWYDKRHFTDHEGEYENNPRVKSGGTGALVQIVLRSRLTGIEIPAWLTLYHHKIVMSLNIEESNSPNSPDIVRLTGTFDLSLFCRIQLQSETLPDDYPFSLLPDQDFPFIGSESNLSTAGQIKVEDPDNPGEQHPHEVLVPIGPGGARVPLRLVWRGILAPKPFGLGAPWVSASEYNSGCCMGLHAIDGATIVGETNDISAIEDLDPSGSPQGTWSPIDSPRYQGRITLIIPGFEANPSTVGCWP